MSVMLDFQVLLTPVVAFMGLSFLLSAVMRHFYQTRYEQLTFGALFGVVIFMGMTNPIVLAEGIIFDTRTLLIASAVAFFGPIAGFIATLFGMASRIYIGGAGMMIGLVGLILTFAVSLAWVTFSHKVIKRPVVQDLSLGIAASSALLAVFLLPIDLAFQFISSLGPTLLILNAVGVVAIGFVLRREKRYFESSRSLEVDARTDSLTKLLNRRGHDTGVQKAKFDPRKGQAILYFDVDDFKSVNDTHGHDVGDAALAIIASRLQVIVRNDAVFARQGGDEFSIYFPAIKRAAVKPIAQRLCETISDQSFSHKDIMFSVSISMGGYWTKYERDHDFMIKAADEQLLLAKQAGKNRAQIAYDHDDRLSSVA